MKLKKYKNRCPFCSRGLQGSAEEVKVGGKYSYVVCSNCGGGVLVPAPTKKQLQKIYGSGKYYEELSAPLSNPLLQWILTRRLFSTPFEWLKENFPKGKILDVGCGNGELLAELKEIGWDVWGSDVSKIAAKNASKKIGSDRIKVGSFPYQKFGNKRFDVISFWHVLEHVDNPSSYLRRAKRLLLEGGCVVGEIPNFDSPLIRLFKSYYSWVMVPEHRIYFSREALLKTSLNAGFKVVELYCPYRALLNLSLSLNNLLVAKGIPPVFRSSIFFLSVPFSVILGVGFSILGKGEVVRFILRC